MGEREAHTLMNLSVDAAKTFYNKVYDLRENDIKKCDPDYQNMMKVNQRLRIGLFFANPARKLSHVDAEKAFEEAKQISDPAYTTHAITEAMS